MDMAAGISDYKFNRVGLFEFLPSLVMVNEGRKYKSFSFFSLRAWVRLMKHAFIKSHTALPTSTSPFSPDIIRLNVSCDGSKLKVDIFPNVLVKFNLSST